VAIAGGVSLQPGAMLVWYLFPGEPFEIGSFHDREGRLLGQYVNLVRPSIPAGARWTVEDLFLDVWLAPGFPPRVLDEDEFEAARRERWLGADDGRLARRALDEILVRIKSGSWPPEAVKRWPLDLVTALRLKRDSPGTYYSALIAGRIIAWGLYLMGAVSATSIGFEALLLLPLTLAGRLPATRWPQPALTDERSLFIATLATGLAVMVLNDRSSWSAAFLPVYGTLGVFSLIFAVCRAWFDRTVPIFALAGLVVTGIALTILL
jgi:predicted RNA-binding protein associated with RNAse of E/G family